MCNFCTNLGIPKRSMEIPLPIQQKVFLIVNNRYEI